MILRHIGDLQDEAGRCAGVAFEFRVELLFDNVGGDFPLLQNLVKKIILPVLPELRMKRHVEQSIRSTLTEDFRREIGKQRFFLTGGGFFHPPDHSFLMEDEKHIPGTGELMKRSRRCEQFTLFAIAPFHAAILEPKLPE